MNIIEKAGSLKSSLPSIFDLAVVGMLFVTFIRNTFYQGTFFIFYSIFILVLTLAIKPRRSYISIPLCLFTLWSLAGVFIHNNIKLMPEFIMNYYLNVSIMFEGFIYILFGVFLFHVIITHSKNTRLLFFVLPIFLYPFFKPYVSGGRITPIAALVVSLIIYLTLKRKFVLAIILSNLGIIATTLMWKWVAMKFMCRPFVWGELLLQIQKTPFVGSGFNHTLFPNNMIYVQYNATGWTFRHNDFLSIGAYLGVIALIMVVLFIVQSIKRIGVTPWLIPFLTIVLTAFFQMTVFSPDKAAVCIIIGAICIKETHKEAV